jgi:methoxymalonate biosynthesis acyl carrier protein
VTNTSNDLVTAEVVRTTLLGFLEQRTRTSWTEDDDVFDSGLVSSMFALELVVHLEKTFAVEIGGADLVPANFRTVTAMTALVLRLGGTRG